jgi:hypothetical protein
MSNEDHKEEEPTKLSLMSIIGSTLSAAIGIQNSKNRQRDFKSGKLMPFIIAGVVFTLLFIGTVFTIVQIVLKNAGH